MKLFLRILASICALTGIVCWTVVTVKVCRWGHSFTGFGAGDGAGGESSSVGPALFGLFLVAAIWILPVGPYLLLALGSLRIINRKVLRIAHFYSLVVLSMLTLVEVLSFVPMLELMASLNILAAVLWVFIFRSIANQQQGA